MEYMKRLLRVPVSVPWPQHEDLYAPAVWKTVHRVGTVKTYNPKRKLPPFTALFGPDPDFGHPAEDCVFYLEDVHKYLWPPDDRWVLSTTV